MIIIIIIIIIIITTKKIIIMLQRNLPLLAKRKNMPALEANTSLRPSRSKPYRPNEHVGTPTLCQSGKKDLLGVRR